MRIYSLSLLIYYGSWTNKILDISLFFQVFIMGFGNIGIDLAKRLRPFGVKIIATKRSWVSHSEVSCHPNGMYNFPS